MQTILAQAPIFRHIPPAERRRLEPYVRLRSFGTGEQLIGQGEASQECYLILAGRVRVEQTAPGQPLPLVLAELGSAELVGHLRPLTGEPRSATVTALAPTTVLEIGQPALEAIMTEYPIALLDLLQRTSRYLRGADELVVSILEPGTN